MRFKEFISEHKDFDLEKFKSDCSYYFKLMKGWDGYLYHGDKSAGYDRDIKQFRSRTRPSDSTLSMHNAMNELFTKRFGFPFRNGLFTTGDRATASLYGRQTIIFPIGRFDWLSNSEKEFYDMTEAADNEKAFLKVSRPELSYDERAAVAEKNILDRMEKSDNWYHNEDLPSCIAGGNEIMIKCDFYYQVYLYGDLFRDTIAPFIRTTR